MLPLERPGIPGDRWANPTAEASGVSAASRPVVWATASWALAGQPVLGSCHGRRRAAGKSLAAPGSGKSLSAGPGHVGGSAALGLSLAVALMLHC